MPQMQRDSWPPATSIPIKLIDESGTNPRKAFDKNKQDELTQSVRTQGVLQPVLVRPIEEDAGESVRYELVYGHRRLRAAKKAGLEAIPAQVRELSDLEVVEIQAIENQQREDVHPLEEADSYRLLNERYGLAVTEIAKRVGKSPTYIYGRLKLCDLGAAVRKVFLAGEVGAAVAYLLARVPPEQQEKALAAVKDQADVDDEGHPVISESHARRVIRDEFMLRMLGASFDPNDATLVAAAGSCVECPKRTGNQPTLFPDVGKDDLCTDPGCWRTKSDASFARAAAAAEKSGQAVLSDKEAAKLFPYGERLATSSKYVDLAEPCYEDAKGRTYGQLLGKKHDVKVTLARDPHGGVHKLADAGAVRKLVRKAGVRETATDYKAAEKRARKKAEEQRAWVGAIIAELVKSAKTAPDTAIYRILLACFEQQGYSDSFKHLAARRGLKVKTAAERRASRSGWKSAEAGELAGLVLEVAVSRNAYYQYASGLDDTVRLAAKELGVDPERIRKRLAKEREAAAKPAKRGRKARA